MGRPTKEVYLMQMAELAATRSPCLRRQVGAVIVLDGQVVATGYNGPARGVPHCVEPAVNVEHPQEEIIKKHICPRLLKNISSGQESFCWAIHAEENALLQAARHGISIKDAELYCTNKPCYRCYQACINAGISAVIYKHPYNDSYVDELAARNYQIRLIQWK